MFNTLSFQEDRFITGWRETPDNYHLASKKKESLDEENNQSYNRALIKRIYPYLKLSKPSIQWKLPKRFNETLDIPNIGDRIGLHSLSWSKNHNIIALGIGKKCYIKNFETNNIFRLFKNGYRKIYSISYTPSDNTIGVGLGLGRLELWNTNTSQCHHRYDDPSCNELLDIDWLNSNTAIVANGKKVMIYDFRQNSPTSQLNSVSEIMNLKVSPNQNNIAAGGEDGRVTIFDIRNPHNVKNLKIHRSGIHGLHWKNSATILTGSIDKSLEMTELNSYQSIFKVETGFPITDMICINNCIISGHSNGSIQFWNDRKLEKIGELDAHENELLMMDYFGTQFCSASADEKLKLWDLPTLPKRKHPETSTHCKKRLKCSTIR